MAGKILKYVKFGGARGQRRKSKINFNESPKFAPLISGLNIALDNILRNVLAFRLVGFLQLRIKYRSLKS